jgi:hypothetical protein
MKRMFSSFSNHPLLRTEIRRGGSEKGSKAS